jgi:hypothetical protein
MGIRVARAARKRQAKKSRATRSAAASRGAKPRAKRVAAKPRAGRGKPAAGSAKKSAKKLAKKPARKSAAKRGPKRASAKKRVVRKSAAKKTAVKNRSAARSSTNKRAVRATTVRAVRKPARRAVLEPRVRATGPRPGVAPAPPAFSVQLAAATPREQLLFEIHRARASVKAAIQGLSAGNAMRPRATGKWSAFEIVLHLSERDRVRLEEFGRVLAGNPRSWAGIEDPEMAAVNELHLAPLRAHTWDEAVRRLDSLREELLRRLGELPAQPDDVWRRGHPFGDMMWGLPEHDRHHAEQLKQARIGSESPVEVSDV